MSDAPTGTTRVAFVCVQNAGRSQMAAAFAERERDRRGLDVEVRSGGTHPASEVHEVVRAVMAEAGFDLSGRTPREISTAELESCDHVATMGCRTLSLDSTVAVSDWDLPDPGGVDPETARAIRDEVERRVSALFDELASTS